MQNALSVSKTGSVLYLREAWQLRKNCEGKIMAYERKCKKIHENSLVSDGNKMVNSLEGDISISTPESDITRKMQLFGCKCKMSDSKKMRSLPSKSKVTKSLPNRKYYNPRMRRSNVIDRESMFPSVCLFEL